MQCPFCQNEMDNAQNACPRCGRKHSPYVAYYVAKGWQDLKRGADTDARSAFNEAMRVTPQNDKAQLASYISYLVQQAGTKGVAGAVAALGAAQYARQAQAAVAAQQQSQPAPTSSAVASSPSPAVSTPAPSEAGQPSAGKATQGLFFDFNEKPINIVRVMDDARRKHADYVRARGVRIWIVPLLLLAGLIFVFLDAVIGYNFLTFSLVGYVLWDAAIVAFIRFMRDRSLDFKTDLDRRPPKPSGACLTIFLIGFFGIWIVGMGAAVIAVLGAIAPVLIFTIIVLIAALVSVILLLRSRPKGKPFGPKFDMARTVFETIKDDVSPRRTLIGWLDLTGPQPGKIIRKRASSTGMPVHYYRDEWLKMKLVLYDGNVMRVTALERIKARMGRWKRKGRWKPGSSASRNELRVALTVNREAYDVLPLRANQYGKFLVDTRESGGDRIVLDALTDAAITAQDVLQVLRFAYSHLKPHNAPATTGGG